MDPTETFGARLRDWRVRRRWTQRQLDAALDKGRSYVAQLESGKLIPPPRDLCELIGQHLAIDPEEVWRAAADERLRRLDADLHAMHGEGRGAGGEFTDDERRLIEAIRRIDAQASPPHPLAPTLLRLANLLGTQWTRPDEAALHAPERVVAALLQLDGCSHRTVARVMEVLVGVVDVVGLERESLGFEQNGPERGR